MNDSAGSRHNHRLSRVLACRLLSEMLQQRAHACATQYVARASVQDLADAIRDMQATGELADFSIRASLAAKPKSHMIARERNESVGIDALRAYLADAEDSEVEVSTAETDTHSNPEEKRGMLAESSDQAKLKMFS